MSGGERVFNLVDAAQLVVDRDVFVGLPVECSWGARGAAGRSNASAFHRVPIRSACTESASGDRRTRVQFVPVRVVARRRPAAGSTNVVQSCQGLQRLLLRFPNAYVPGVKVFEANGEGDRTNQSLGFALYDHRVGPTEEEEAVLRNIDDRAPVRTLPAPAGALALFLRTTIIRCDRIRRALKLGMDTMTPEQQKVAIEMMELHVARPSTANTDGPMRNRRASGRPVAPRR